MSMSGREASQMSGSVQRPSQMTGSGREALPDVHEWLEGPS